MPEILTESFCERCGTRYTFESGAPKVRLKGLKVMSRGLRNFVMSDDTSMDEAMAAARNETDREQTTHQLDAFHRTFNFCMNCRQYTCGNCWNEAEGRCLSCAPHLGQEIVPAPFGNVAAGGAMTVSGPEAVGLHEHNGHDLASPQPEPLAWPTSDLMREAEAASAPDLLPEPEWARPVRPVDEVEAGSAMAAEAAPATEPVGAADEPFDFAARLEAVSGPPSVAEPPVAAGEVSQVERGPDAAPDAAQGIQPPAVEPAPVDDRAAAAAAHTSDLLHRFRPGQNLDDEIEAYERAHASEIETAESPVRFDPTAPVVSDAVPDSTEPTPAGPLVASPEPIYPEPEPSPIEPFAAPEPAAAEPAAGQRPTAEPGQPPTAEPERVAATAAPVEVPTAPVEPRVDYVPQPTWQIVAPDAPEVVPAAPSQLPVEPPAPAVAESAEPQWPSTPQWPERDASVGLPFLGRPPAATGGIEALWAASAREVAQVSHVPQAGPAAVARSGGVQPCVSCGLSLSANARFCRRCGTRQD